VAQASSGADRECASCSSTRAGRERRVRTCQSESLDGDTDEHGSFWRVVPRERERRKRGAAWKHECSAGAERAECAWTRNGAGGRPDMAAHLAAGVVRSWAVIAAAAAWEMQPRARCRRVPQQAGGAEAHRESALDA